MSTSEPTRQTFVLSGSAQESEKTAIASPSLLTVLMNFVVSREDFDALFQEINAAISFEAAIAVETFQNGLRCLAAQPPDLTERMWQDRQPTKTFQVCTRSKTDRNDAHDFLRGVVDDGRPTLGLPIATAAGTVMLVLFRSPGAQDFDHSSVEFAKKLELLSLTALSLVKRLQSETNIDRLCEEIQSIGQAESVRTDSFLNHVVNELPIGLTVQDENGRFIVVNRTAARGLGMQEERLLGASPADFLPQEEAANRRAWERDLLRRPQSITVEAKTTDQGSERTWLTMYQSVHILERPLLVTSAFDITEYKAIERGLIEGRRFDQLTGLPDRESIQEYVETIIRNDAGTRNFALAFIDLDNFKQVNDYYSHTIGDALLMQISRRISGKLDQSSMLARISGDEFLLLLDPAESEEQILATINHILESLKQPLFIEGFEIFASCSIGISIYPQHGRSYESLRRNADSAMYRAKHSAKGTAVLFDTNMVQAVTARMEIEQRLRLAIRDRKFCCAFQPKIDIDTQQTIGFEALVRWIDDAGEIHPPGDFVGLAVDLGLINPITMFVLEEAVNSMERLDDAFGSDTTISINIAAKQAEDVEFMRLLGQYLRDTNCASRFVFELTEEAFIAKGTFQTEVLPLLRDIGVRVSIDDFGAGYSSLGVLADITADEVKIDRSFISGIHKRPRNQSVLRAIESLCHALGMTVVAEGVESYEELVYIQAATRIRCVQGFYFARPFYLEEMNNNTEFANRSRNATRASKELQRANDLRSTMSLRGGARA